jgi:hypothetical protein
MTSDTDYTVAEISARWKCHPESVRRKIRSGELPSTYLSGKHLVAGATLAAAEKSAATNSRQTRK